MKRVYIITPDNRNRRKSHWNRAGVVFDPNKDGSVNFKLDIFPNTKFQIREDDSNGKEPENGTEKVRD